MIHAAWRLLGGPLHVVGAPRRSRSSTLMSGLSAVWCVVALVAGSAHAADEHAATRDKMLVLDLKSDVVDAATARTITNLVTLELSHQGAFDVITTSDVARLAELEGNKQAMGCDAGSCLAELAGALGARYVVTGDIGKLASTVIVNLTLFDASKATAIERTAAQGSVDELATRLPRAVQDLTQSLRGAVASTAPAAAAPTKGAPVAASSTSDGWRAPTAWTSGVVGALVLAGAAGFDVVSPSSNDASFTLHDVVGPAGIVVGAGLVVTAVVVGSGADDGGVSGSSAEGSR